MDPLAEKPPSAAAKAADQLFTISLADRPKSETRALRSIFAPKAAAILRVLLRDPGQPWRVTELAAAANASLGHVSNIRKALLAREWIEKGTNGTILVQPDALLRTWRDEYREPAGRRISGYTLFHGEQLNKDLWLGDDREREAADHLASKCFPWL